MADFGLTTQTWCTGWWKWYNTIIMTPSKNREINDSGGYSGAIYVIASSFMYHGTNFHHYCNYCHIPMWIILVIGYMCVFPRLLYRQTALWTAWIVCSCRNGSKYFLHCLVSSTSRMSQGLYLAVAFVIDGGKLYVIWIDSS